MAININSNSDNENESSQSQQEITPQHGAISVDDCIKDKIKERVISSGDLSITNAIPKARSRMNYPQYISWKDEVLRSIKDLRLSYLLEEEDTKERYFGDHELMSIAFRKISPLKPRDRNWKALWERINSGLYRGDDQKKQTELSTYLRMSADGEKLDWLAQLDTYEKIAKELNMSTDLQVICDKLIIENGWSNTFEWRHLFQNVSSLDDIASALELGQDYDQWTSVQTSAIVSSVDHKNASSPGKHRKRSKTNQDSVKVNKKQKRIYYKSKEEGYCSQDCLNQEKGSYNNSKNEWQINQSLVMITQLVQKTYKDIEMSTKFFVDSEATISISTNKTLFKYLNPSTIGFRLAAGQIITAIGPQEMIITTKQGKIKTEGFYVNSGDVGGKELNILSQSKLLSKGYIFHYTCGTSKMMLGDIAYNLNKMYNLFYLHYTESQQYQFDQISSLHNRFNHVSTRALNKFRECYDFSSQDIAEIKKHQHCFICSKLHLHSNNTKHIFYQRTEKPNHKLHTGITFYKDNTIFLVLDEATSYWWAYNLKAKSEAVQILIKICEAFPGFKQIFTDNGREFQNQCLHNYCAASNIALSFYPPYYSKTNGMIERAKGLLKAKLEKAVNNLVIEPTWTETQLDDYFEDILSYVVQIHNLSPTRARQPPIIKFKNWKKISKNLFHVFGCRVWYQEPATKQNCLGRYIGIGKDFFGYIIENSVTYDRLHVTDVSFPPLEEILPFTKNHNTIVNNKTQQNYKLMETSNQQDSSEEQVEDSSDEDFDFEYFWSVFINRDGLPLLN